MGSNSGPAEFRYVRSRPACPIARARPAGASTREARALPPGAGRQGRAAGPTVRRRLARASRRARRDPKSRETYGRDQCSLLVFLQA
jgi:hypothetical protein